jgi:hypothetical protein
LPIDGMDYFFITQGSCHKAIPIIDGWKGSFFLSPMDGKDNFQKPKNIF